MLEKLVGRGLLEAKIEISAAFPPISARKILETSTEGDNSTPGWKSEFSSAKISCENNVGCGGLLEAKIDRLVG